MRKETPNSHSSSERKPLTFDDELLVEWNLLRILGMYFCLDNKKAATLKGPQSFFDTLNDPDQVKKKPVQIIPNIDYGYPSLGALKVFFAILRKFAESSYPIPREIYLSQREFHRLIGSRHSGGFQSKKLARYLLQLRFTVIESRRYYKEKKQWFFRPYTLLSDMYLSGRKNTLTTCYIELDKEVHANINAFYGLRFFYNRLDNLSPTEKILYINLFNSLSLVAKKRNREKDFFYNKEYKKLIECWLPNFKILTQQSVIKRDQLGCHFDGLVKCALLSDWKIRKNKNNTDFVFIFYPGEAFFKDRIQIHKSKSCQTRLPVDENQDNKKKIYQDQRDLLIYFFSKLYPGEGHILADVFSEKDQKSAEIVLSQLTLAEAKRFVDYALDEQAPKTNYTPKVFKGIEQYLIGYMRIKDQKKVAQLAEEEKQQKIQYDYFYTRTIHGLRNEMPFQLLKEFEKTSRIEIKKEEIQGFMTDRFIIIYTNKKIASYYNIPNFEKWKSTINNKIYTVEKLMEAKK